MLYSVDKTGIVVIFYRESKKHWRVSVFYKKRKLVRTTCTLNFTSRWLGILNLIDACFFVIVNYACQPYDFSKVIILQKAFLSRIYTQLTQGIKLLSSAIILYPTMYKQPLSTIMSRNVRKRSGHSYFSACIDSLIWGSNSMIRSTLIMEDFDFMAILFVKKRDKKVFLSITNIHRPGGSFTKMFVCQVYTSSSCVSTQLETRGITWCYARQRACNNSLQISLK